MILQNLKDRVKTIEIRVANRNSQRVFTKVISRTQRTLLLGFESSPKPPKLTSIQQSVIWRAEVHLEARFFGVGRSW